LNFIGVFVVFALGADNVFVATDKWKNARIEHPTASTLAIAGSVLPDSAGAMFLTTITTAIAFFGTAICPVAPIKLFAIFCGLLIMFDYILCILLVFPALCIYDRRLQAKKANLCIACHCCHNSEGSSDDDDDEDKQSLIRRILLKFYHGLHKIRWGLLFFCAVGFGVCIYFATTLELPTSADVRILGEDNEYEQNYGKLVLKRRRRARHLSSSIFSLLCCEAWRKLLLYDVLGKSGGSEVSVGFGLIASDTGDLSKSMRSLVFLRSHVLFGLTFPNYDDRQSGGMVAVGA
jgi:predicted RND superfamily exporter protein